MTIYQDLIERANKCRQAAIRAGNDGFKKVWMDKANELETRAANLPVTLAVKVVR